MPSSTALRPPGAGPRWVKAVASATSGSTSRTPQNPLTATALTGPAAMSCGVTTARPTDPVRADEDPRHEEQRVDQAVRWRDQRPKHGSPDEARPLSPGPAPCRQVRWPCHGEHGRPPGRPGHAGVEGGTGRHSRTSVRAMPVRRRRSHRGPVPPLLVRPRSEGDPRPVGPAGARGSPARRATPGLHGRSWRRDVHQEEWTAISTTCCRRLVTSRGRPLEVGARHALRRARGSRPRSPPACGRGSRGRISPRKPESPG